MVGAGEAVARLGKRPERSGQGADEWYSGAEVTRYSAENVQRQRELALAALRLLGLHVPLCAWNGDATTDRKPSSAESNGGRRACGGVVLDLGSGSGLSSAAVREAGALLPPAEQPLLVLGCDLSRAMLQEARQRMQGPRKGMAAAGLAMVDFSHELPVRDGVCEHAVSISAIQWLQTPDARQQFFASLWRALRPGGRAALQFYPASAADAEEMLQSALRGPSHAFSGALVLDMPHAAPQRKWFLCLRKAVCLRCRGGECGAAACADASAAAAVAAMPQCELAYPYRATCAVSWRETVVNCGKEDRVAIERGEVALARAKKLPAYFQLHRQHLQRGHALTRLQLALEAGPSARKSQRVTEASADAASGREKPRKGRRRGTAKSLANEIPADHATELDIALARRMSGAVGQTPTFAMLQGHFGAVMAALHDVPPPASTAVSVTQDTVATREA